MPSAKRSRPEDWVPSPTSHISPSSPYPHPASQASELPRQESPQWLYGTIGMLDIPTLQRLLMDAAIAHAPVADSIAQVFEARQHAIVEMHSRACATMGSGRVTSQTINEDGGIQFTFQAMASYTPPTLDIEGAKALSKYTGSVTMPALDTPTVDSDRPRPMESTGGCKASNAEPTVTSRSLPEISHHSDSSSATVMAKETPAEIEQYRGYYNKAVKSLRQPCNEIEESVLQYLGQSLTDQFATWFLSMTHDVSETASFGTKASAFRTMYDILRALCETKNHKAQERIIYDTNELDGLMLGVLESFDDDELYKLLLGRHSWPQDMVVLRKAAGRLEAFGKLKDVVTILNDVAAELNHDDVKPDYT